jgi:hypothetical protein
LIGETCLEDLVIEALRCRTIHQKPEQSNSSSPNHFNSSPSKGPSKRFRQLSLGDENGNPLEQPVTVHSLLLNQDLKTTSSEMIEIQQLPQREVALLKGHQDEV